MWPDACLRGFPALAVTEREIKPVKLSVTIIVGDRDPRLRMTFTHSPLIG
jgi:hypothetical protein